MMLGRAALAHLRNSFHGHGHVRPSPAEVSKSVEQLTNTRDSIESDRRSISTSSSSGGRTRTNGLVKRRRTSRTVSPSSRRSSVSTSRRYSAASAQVVDTDDDGVVLVKEDQSPFFDILPSSSKFDLLHAVRYKVEHNDIYKSTPGEKRRICSVLGDHLRCGDADLVLYAAQLVEDVVPHLGEADACMAGLVMPGLIPCLGNGRINIRKAAIQALQIYLKFTSDIQSVLKGLVHHGLEHHDRQVVLETLVTVPQLFQDLENLEGNKNLSILVVGLAKKLQIEETRLPAFMAMQKIANIVGPKQFQAYMAKLNEDQRKIYEGLSEESPLDVLVGRKLSASSQQMAPGFMEYGAIDDTIVEKLRDDEDIKIRLQGAEELNRTVKSMKDISGLMPQMRQFLNFLDSVFEEQNFKLNLLILEVYSILIEKMRSKVRSHLRTLCVSLLRHASHSKIVVRIENFRVIKKLMVHAKPNTVITHLFEHLGDKRSTVREDILNVVMFGLLTFPSYEFDLKNIAATVVPTLVDPKRRVRQASQECVAVLAAFMGPNKAAPLIRSIELLENHFERGSGVLNAVQARLARRQLPRITPDGLVEYSLQIPNSSRAKSPGGPAAKYPSDIEWILAGSGSVSSGSAKSISTLRSELDESLSSSNSFPNSPAMAAPATTGRSPVSINGVALQRQRQRDLYRKDLLSLSASTGTRYQLRSRSQETLGQLMRSVRDEDDDLSDGFSCDEEDCSPKRSYTESEIQNNNNNTTLKDLNGKHVKYSGSVSELSKKSSMNNDSAELPRLIGTKSQASTASSSATRDSGISLNDMQQQQLIQLQQQLQLQQQQMSKKQLQRSGSTRGSLQKLISIDDLPVNGRAVSLSTRPGTNRSSLDDLTMSSVGPSRTGSKQNLRSEIRKASSVSCRQSISRESTSRHSKRSSTLTQSQNMKQEQQIKKLEATPTPIATATTTTTMTTPNKGTLDLVRTQWRTQNRRKNGEFLPSVTSTNPRRKSYQCDDVTPPRSPRFPVQTPGSINSETANHLLTRRTDNSPFALVPRSTGVSSSNSTPYSQISVPSSYDYEEDFTSDSESEMSTLAANNRSAQSQRTVGSTTSTAGSSRIPIKRNSSLRRKKEVMNIYNKSTDGNSADSKSEDNGNDNEEKEILSPIKDPPRQVETMEISKPAHRFAPKSSKKLSLSPPIKRSVIPPRTLPLRSISHQPTTSTSTTTPPTHRFLRSSSPSKIPTSAKTPETARANRTLSKSGPSTPLSPKPSRRAAILERRIPSSGSQTSLHKISSSKLPRRAQSNDSLAQEQTPKTPLLVSAAAANGIDPAEIVPIFNNSGGLRHSPLLPRKSISTVESLPDINRPESLPKEVDDETTDANDVIESYDHFEEHQPEPVEEEPPPARKQVSVASTPPEVFATTSAPSNQPPTIANGLSLKTQVTLKSPIEGQNLGPYHKPEDFLERITNNLASPDWEANVNGMTGIYRLVQHHPDYLLSEYKPLLQHLMNHVKNLRSQVCRAAVMVVGELFIHLKRNMESDLDKIILILLNKSGDTNKFLREDCNVALDHIVENVSHIKVISVITSPEIIGHKNPVVRSTVSRMLAYTVDRIGVSKAVSGTKDVTDKILPAIAKLSQDGSPDARNFAKFTLQRMLLEYPSEMDKLLKKYLSANTLRNLEKLLDNLRQPNGRSGRSSGRRGDSRKTL